MHMSKYILKDALIASLKNGLKLKISNDYQEWSRGYSDAINDIINALESEVCIGLTWHEVMVRGIEEELKG